MTKKKRAKHLSGLINVNSSGHVSLDDIKYASKKMGATINDIAMGALTTAMNVIMKEENDPST